MLPIRLNPKFCSMVNSEAAEGLKTEIFFSSHKIFKDLNLLIFKSTKIV